MRFAIVLSLLSFFSPQAAASFPMGEDDEAAIRVLIQEAYIDGLENLGDLDRTRDGFHPDFVLLHLRNDEMVGTPISDWIVSAERRRAEGQPPAGTTVEFVSIDITGAAAIAKIELWRTDDLVFTDYLSFYRFSGGWRIVGKIYEDHR